MVAHQFGPECAGGAVLCDFFEQIVVGVEEEAEPRCEVVDRQAASETLLDVVPAVGEREGQLLGGGGTGFADVVAADGNGVPLRRVLRAELDQVDDQPHGRLGREHDFVLRVKFFEDVVLNRAAEIAPVDAADAGGGEVERHDDDRRRVDRHRDGNLAQVDLVEEREHVVDRVDGDAESADFAGRAWVVAVEAHQRRQIERGAQAGLALVEQIAEPLVRVGRAAEAGELAHRPEPIAVHRFVDAAREREIGRAGRVRGRNRNCRGLRCV